MACSAATESWVYTYDGENPPHTGNSNFNLVEYFCHNFIISITVCYNVIVVYFVYFCLLGIIIIGYHLSFLHPTCTHIHIFLLKLSDLLFLFVWYKIEDLWVRWYLLCLGHSKFWHQYLVYNFFLSGCFLYVLSIRKIAHKIAIRK